MNNSMNNRLLKARTTTRSNRNFNDVRNNSAPALQPFSHKRKCEFIESSASSPKQSVKNETHSSIREDFNSTSRCSANNRLQKYRASLSDRKNEVVKVHQALSSTSSAARGSESSNNDNINKFKDSKWKSTSVLGKRPLFTSGTDLSSELSIKKRKSYEGVKNIENNQIHVSKEIDDQTTDMDWSPINEDEIISNIQKFRERRKENPVLLESTISSSSEMTARKPEDNSTEKVIYVVVDTNIFISHLTLIKNIINENYNEITPIVYVPWMVVQELDYFKDGRIDSSTMLNAAQRAVKFINQNLIDKPTRLKGQTVLEALLQKESSANADDIILFSCMHLAENRKSVILLSNDVNLRNKALINSINTYGPKDIIKRIKGHLGGSDQNKKKIHEINKLFSNMCTEIIISEMEQAYGSVLYRLITKPPWDLKQCLVYMKRFWSPVFSLVIKHKQCLKVIEDLLTFIQTSEDVSDTENTNELMRLCFSICVYFKNNLRKYHESIISCIQNMQDVLR